MDVEDFSNQQNACDNDNREKCEKRKRTDEISDSNERVKKFCFEVQSMAISQAAVSPNAGLNPGYNSSSFLFVAFGNPSYPTNNFVSNNFSNSDYSNYSPNSLFSQSYTPSLPNHFLNHSHSVNNFSTNNYPSNINLSNTHYQVKHETLTTDSGQMCMSSFIVLVRTLTGRILEIEAYPQDTVLRLKERIQIRDGIPPAQQRLIYTGKALSDAQLLQFAGIKHKSTVHLVLGFIG